MGGLYLQDLSGGQLSKQTVTLECRVPRDLRGEDSNPTCEEGARLTFLEVVTPGLCLEK